MGLSVRFVPPSRGMSNLKLQVSKLFESTKAVGGGPVSTPVVEVPSKDKPILVPV